MCVHCIQYLFVSNPAKQRILLLKKLKKIFLKKNSTYLTNVIADTQLQSAKNFEDLRKRCNKALEQRNEGTKRALLCFA